MLWATPVENQTQKMKNCFDAYNNYYNNNNNEKLTLKTSKSATDLSCLPLLLYILQMFTFYVISGNANKWTLHTTEEEWPI